MSSQSRTTTPLVDQALWHPLTDTNFADHRDPEQWEFFVAPKEMLPHNQQTIGLTSLRNLTGVVSAEHLAEKVAGRVAELK